MFFSVLLVASFALKALSVPTVGAFTSPKITSFGLNGSGCPPGSTSSSTDGSSVSAVFSQFNPEVSNASPIGTRQNCQASIAISIPAGQQITLSSVKYEGYADLDSKTAVTHGSTYYFQADINQNSASGKLTGPIVKSVDLSNTFSGGAIWSKCGGDVVLNVDIAVIVTNTDDKADGSVAVDTAKFGPFTTRSC